MAVTSKNMYLVIKFHCCFIFIFLARLNYLLCLDYIKTQTSSTSSSTSHFFKYILIFLMTDLASFFQLYCYYVTRCLCLFSVLLSIYSFIAFSSVVLILSLAYSNVGIQVGQKSNYVKFHTWSG